MTTQIEITEKMKTALIEFNKDEISHILSQRISSAMYHDQHRELLDFFVVVVIRPSAASTSAKISSLAIDHHAEIGSSIMVSCAQPFSASQATNFINHRNRLIVKVSNLRVSRLPVIVHAKASTNTDCFGGDALLTNCPSALVNIVGTEIADFPSTGIPKPVPIIVQVFPH